MSFSINQFRCAKGHEMRDVQTWQKEVPVIYCKPCFHEWLATQFPTESVKRDEDDVWNAKVRAQNEAENERRAANMRARLLADPPGPTWDTAMACETKEQLREYVPLTVNVDDVWAECERRRALRKEAK